MLVNLFTNKLYFFQNIDDTVAFLMKGNNGYVMIGAGIVERHESICSSLQV